MEKHNKKILEKVDSKELAPFAALRGLLPVPKRVPNPSLSWCRRFLSNYGYSLLTSGSSAQAWLPYHHPDMLASREHLKQMLAESVHPALVINYDQVWRTAFTFGGKLVWKPREEAGKRSKRKKLSQRDDKKHHYIKGSRRSITVACPRVSMLVGVQFWLNW